MTTLAIALTGLPRQEAEAAIVDLRREGLNRPAPTRGEVDAWLSEQMWRSQHEPTLTPSKRATVLNRLRGALHRVLPDGPTFHAWRNLAAECFARTRRKVAAVLLAAPLMMGLGACGSSAHQDAHAAPSGTVATAPATPSNTQQSSQPVVGPAVYDADAVATFGQQRAEQGYREATEVAITYALQPGLLANTQPTPADLDGITAHMTPSAAADYRAKVHAALAGDDTARQAVQVSTLYGVEGQGYRMATSGPAVTDQQVSTSTVTVDRSSDAERLRVSLEHSATLHGSQSDTPATARAIQDVTYLLAPSSTSPSGWAIDGWTGTYRVLDPVPG
ncbi:hypothetical protein [Modestobacter sp. KNN46-3]|uniref:hypothetical protein n=1 Tax=Modestobacter sp. KNN46-3 TaxID=2711218 RepID=UPI0013DFE1BC|nr:hypothetical protein [Modestobacter sp. KNN46-3]